MIKQLFMIDRRMFKHFDWVSLFIVLILSLIGIMTIYSSTRPVLGAEHEAFFIKQFYWLFISLICLFVFVHSDYKWLKKYGYIIFLFGIILLILVIVLGRTGMGARRWISLGFVSFQPSEFFKLFFIIAFSKYLAEIDMESKKSFNFLDLFKAGFLFLLLPMGMIMIQPDLGTSLMLLFIFSFMILIAGIKRKVIVLITIICLIAFPFFKDILWSGLKGYQKNRIIAFLDPSIDPKGIGYQIKQSKVTIGSGGIIGKGYLRGTQGPLRFLPERHTDFIFSIFAEEWGFIGSILLFLLYLVFLLRGIDTSMRAKDNFGTFLGIGVTAMFFFYFTINIGMTLGIMPVVGVPLPFMSYGGTSLLSNYIAVGMLINVRTRRLPMI